MFAPLQLLLSSSPAPPSLMGSLQQHAGKVFTPTNYSVVPGCTSSFAKASTREADPPSHLQSLYRQVVTTAAQPQQLTNESTGLARLQCNRL